MWSPLIVFALESDRWSPGCWCANLGYLTLPCSSGLRILPAGVYRRGILNGCPITWDDAIRPEGSATLWSCKVQTLLIWFFNFQVYQLQQLLSPEDLWFLASPSSPPLMGHIHPQKFSSYDLVNIVIYKRSWHVAWQHSSNWLPFH